MMRAKIGAMNITWTPIGNETIDDKQTSHFDELRKTILNVFEGGE